jgi:dienelactone hydrolase
MTASPVYRPHREAPSTTQLFPLESSVASLTSRGAFSEIDSYRFEIVSRGDFVPGILYLPPSTGDASNPRSGDRGAPLVLLQHGLAGSKESAYLECAARWVRDGFAVATIDLPLHGERSSPKLSARLFQGIENVLSDQHLDAETFALVEEFARQSTSDLVRTLDALSLLESIDETKIGFVGFSLGAVVGAYLLAHDPRPSVAVLALAGGGRGPGDLDPARYISITPRSDETARRPLLVIAAEDDKRVSAESTRALFDAAREPKEFLVSPGDHGTLSGKTLGRIQSFLRDAFTR